MSNAPAPDAGDGLSNVMVACIQMEPRIGEKSRNLEKSVALIEEAAARGARLIVLPELANTGYVFRSRAEAFSLAEPIIGGETVAVWTQLCQRLDVHLVAGIAERADQKLFNSAVVLGPGRVLATYRKLHLWGDEHLFFEAGDLGLPVVHTPLGRIAAVICYDGWFPEVYRLIAAQGADIVCMPTNWVPMPSQPDDRPAMATTLAMANAHANGLCIVCADRVGTERGQQFIGQSTIVGSDGWPVAGPASKDGEEVLCASLDLNGIRRGRQLNPFNHVLRDRRSDFYHLTNS